MLDQFFPTDLAGIAQFAGSLCQMTTAVIAVAIGVVTFRYTRRQNSLALINQNNTLANLVNTTLVQSPEAREALGKLHDFVVGCPDDAILFMYLNYVHNTFRTYQIGAISEQVWTDTLGSCGAMVSRLKRQQVERLLGRGYEKSFQVAVLACYDRLLSAASVSESSTCSSVVAPFPQRHAAVAAQAPKLALAS